jgi:tetratricopeptide (TPR) repeat protein
MVSRAIALLVFCGSLVCNPAAASASTPPDLKALRARIGALQSGVARDSLLAELEQAATEQEGSADPMTREEAVRSLAFCDLARALALRASGNALPALTTMDKALARYESIQDTAGMVAAMEDRRDLYLSRGDLEAYLKSCEHLLGLYTILGDSTNIGWELANISLALTNLGHGSEALGYMRRSWRIFEQMGDSTELAFSCIELGRAHRAMGNLDSAFHYAELEVRFMQRRGLGMDLCRAFYHRAEVWEQMHAVDSALADLRRSTACTERSDSLKRCCSTSCRKKSPKN